MKMIDCSNPLELQQWLLANPNSDETHNGCTKLREINGGSFIAIDNWISKNRHWLEEFIHITFATSESIEFNIGDWPWVSVMGEVHFGYFCDIDKKRGIIAPRYNHLYY